MSLPVAPPVAVTTDPTVQPAVLPSNVAVAGLVLPRPRPVRPPPTAPSLSFSKFMYTAEELRATPSILDGMTHDDERRARYDCAASMGRLAELLRLPEEPIVEILSTAMLLLQRFFARRSMLKVDRYLMATVCLFHSLKITAEEKCMQHTMAMASAHLQVAPGRASLTPEACAATAAEIVEAEFRLVEALEYEFPDPHCDLAWGYLDPLVAALATTGAGGIGVAPPPEVITQIRKTIAECMRTTLPLTYDPPTLAKAALRIVLSKWAAMGVSTGAAGVPSPEAVAAAVPLEPAIIQDITSTLTLYLHLMSTAPPR